MPQDSFLPLVVFVFVGLVVVALFYVPAVLFGPKVDTQPKLMPFECGNDPIGEPTVPFNPRFYQVAILFLIFDIEIAFFYPWAVLCRELGFRGLLVVGVFISVLVFALVYVVKKRVLRFV